MSKAKISILKQLMIKKDQNIQKKLKSTKKKLSKSKVPFR